MAWNSPTTSHLLEWAGAAGLALWGIYKKELQDYFKACCKRLYGRWHAQQIAQKVQQEKWAVILGDGLTGLETYLLLLLKEYRADRVTVMEYAERDGSHWATCVAEAREWEMPSVEKSWQHVELPPAMWREVERINALPGRCRSVPDARTEDVAPLRAALRSSGVRSAHYQSMPTPDGQPRAMLSLSWHAEHLVSPEQAKALQLSGVACATILLLMGALTPPTSTD